MGSRPPGDDIAEDGAARQATTDFVEQPFARLSNLVGEIETAAPAPPANSAFESRLVEVRLGIASGLFVALRHKHAPTAAHSLRVALGASSWAFAVGMADNERDELEIAALLHDVGKIGAPDRLLLKPGALTSEEAVSMDRYRLSVLEILASCCPSRPIVEIIRHAGGWYDGSRPNYPLVGEEIPVGARMLAVVDAFDSMISDQLYRPAMSRDRALNELFRNAGTQFDPELVRSFDELQVTSQLHRQVVSHWLKSLDPQQSNRFWQTLNQQHSQAVSLDELFRRRLLDNMNDAVIFVDRHGEIQQWNPGAERLTGIRAASVVNRAWSPSLIGLRDERSGTLGSTDCPIDRAIATGVQSLRRMLVANRDNRPVVVDVHTVPVVDPEGLTYGAAILLRDMSPEAKLEEQCERLHDEATQDLLTGTANRAEFDRALPAAVNSHFEKRLPCGLIMCDLDRFKLINDTYGHQAGDEVLKFFGHLLNSQCRAEDLVARYGGEEFAILCSDCNNASAAQRAEQLRKAMSDLPQAATNGNAVTVSFGVTELQPGDTPESFLRRADRALLEAKKTRNLVVQLGDGRHEENASQSSSACRAEARDTLVEQTLISAVPVNIAVEKLRGFVLDHDAKIASARGDQIELEITPSAGFFARRGSDRGAALAIELRFAEQRSPTTAADGRQTGHVSRTRVQVAIRLKTKRDRRTTDQRQRAAAIFSSIRSYLMAQDVTEADNPDVTVRPANIVARWLQPQQ